MSKGISKEVLSALLAARGMNSEEIAALLAGAEKPAVVFVVEKHDGRGDNGRPGFRVARKHEGPTAPDARPLPNLLNLLYPKSKAEFDAQEPAVLECVRQWIDGADEFYKNGN